MVPRSITRNSMDKIKSSVCLYKLEKASTLRVLFD